MDTTDTPNTSQGDRQCVPEEKPPLSQEVEPPPEQSEQSKTKKKKKKSGKKNSSSIEPLQKPAEESEGAAEELVSVQCFKVITVCLRWAVWLVDFMSECILGSRRAAEKGAGLVHRAAGAGPEVSEGHTEAELVRFVPQ